MATHLVTPPHRCEETPFTARRCAEGGGSTPDGGGEGEGGEVLEQRERAEDGGGERDDDSLPQPAGGGDAYCEIASPVRVPLHCQMGIPYPQGGGTHKGAPMVNLW